MDITDVIMKKVATALLRINPDVDKAKAQEVMIKTAKVRIPEIIEEMRSDAKRADLFGGIDKGALHPLAKTAGIVALDHGCVMWAKEINEATLA